MEQWPIIHLDHSDPVSKAKWQAHVKPSFWLHGDNNWRVEKPFIIPSAAKKFHSFSNIPPPILSKVHPLPSRIFSVPAVKAVNKGQSDAHDDHVWTRIRRNGGDCLKERNQKTRYKWNPCLYLSRCTTSLVLLFLLCDQQWEFQCSLSLSATEL